MRNLKIIVEYDGSGYHGWQRQEGLTTVQQILEESIGRITREKITVVGSGRTDAGVHALNQSAHFKTSSCIGARNLLLGINSLLPHGVVVKELKEMDGLFHARFDVKSKVYLYQIFNNPVRSALYRNYAWHVRAPLD
ncbi:MAG TPA: tRNA pseudouridine(38-40) synthase TruA, partial [Syntrophales bacterium]|nr:tRNA pseudouridine(38-40) synthase TruA [Syntrophales bacterium]